MSYSKLLNKIIGSTNYTQEEISQKCKELGVNISREKVNALQNYRTKPPKPEVSRALAKVCNVDERLLVTEGYFENAPEEVKEVLRGIQSLVNISALIISTKTRNLTAQDINEIQKFLDKESISESLIQMMDQKEKSIELLKNNLNFIEEICGTTISFNLPIGIEITDNGMFPLIENKNKIILNIQSIEQCNTSNIVAYVTKNDKTVKARIFSKVNSTYVMIPLNKEYKQEIYSKDDINILGTVTQVIKDI